MHFHLFPCILYSLTSTLSHNFRPGACSILTENKVDSPCLYLTSCSSKVIYSRFSMMSNSPSEIIYLLYYYTSLSHYLKQFFSHFWQLFYGRHCSSGFPGTFCLVDWNFAFRDKVPEKWCRVLFGETCQSLLHSCSLFQGHGWEHRCWEEPCYLSVSERPGQGSRLPFLSRFNF